MWGAFLRWDKYGYFFAIICVLAATGVFLLGRDIFAKGQWALLYLLIIVLVAALAGFRASLVASLLSFLTWNYFFLPPYNTLIVHDVKDWLSLAVFLAVGIAMGLQTGRMHDREKMAIARERETILLNRLSAHLVSVASTHAMSEMLIEEIQQVTGTDKSILFLADDSGKLLILPADENIDRSIISLAEWVNRQNKAIGLPDISSLTQLGVKGWPISVPHSSVMTDAVRTDIFLPLQTTTRVEGVLYIGPLPSGKPYTLYHIRLLVSIANLAATFLERQRLEMAAAKIEALRDAENMKSTLVSSVSHELKTPLAAVTATVTSLLEDDIILDADTIRGELSAAKEDLDRLNDQIGALIDLSRLKADAWSPQREWCEFGELVGTLIAKLSINERKRITYTIPPDLPPLFVDSQQLLQALQHLVENALAYSPVDTIVTIGAITNQKEFRLWVEDQGEGIPIAEREHVFEQFYRGASSAHAPSGTGLGLTITSEIIRYHGGRMWIEDVQPHGARFVIALPFSGEGNS